MAEMSNLESISSTFYARIFCMKVLCAACCYLHVTREKLPKSLLYEKGACKMLMKLTPVYSCLVTITLLITASWQLLSNSLSERKLFFPIRKTSADISQSKIWRSMYNVKHYFRFKDTIFSSSLLCSLHL